MSAIFGIIRKTDDVITNEESIAIQTALQHRATDGQGIYYDKNILIGNHQLQESNFQQNETLPYQEGGYVITAESLLEDRGELIKKLNCNGDLTNAPDTVLILKSYIKWGDKCVNYLEGEFVFCIWNAVTQTFFAATDHIGFRPMYYYASATQFIFASEIKGILAVKPKPNYFNEAFLINSIAHNRDGTTFNKEIFILRSASQLTFSIDNNASITLNISKYWELSRKGRYQFNNDDDWAECLKDLTTSIIKTD